MLIPPLPSSLLEKVTSGKYVDFNALLNACDLGSGSTIESSSQSVTKDGNVYDISITARAGRPRVHDYLSWSQAWVFYFDILARFRPDRFPQLAAYQMQINQYAREFADSAWIKFDAVFRQYAANNPGVAWSKLNDVVFNSQLRGAPRGQARMSVTAKASGASGGCFKCGRIGHMARACKAVPQETTPSTAPIGTVAVVRRAPQPMLPCPWFNQGTCRLEGCRKPHVCRRCGGPHSVSSGACGGTH